MNKDVSTKVVINVIVAKNNKNDKFFSLKTNFSKMARTWEKDYMHEKLFLINVETESWTVVNEQKTLSIREWFITLINNFYFCREDLKHKTLKIITFEIYFRSIHNVEKKKRNNLCVSTLSYKIFRQYITIFDFYLNDNVVYKEISFLFNNKYVKYDINSISKQAKRMTE